MSAVIELYSPESIRQYLVEVDKRYTDIVDELDFTVLSFLNDDCESCTKPIDIDDYVDALEYFGGKEFMGQDPCMSGSSFITISHNGKHVGEVYLPNYESWVVDITK